MRMSFSDYLENKVLDHVTGKASYTAPTAFVGLSTADPLDDGSGLAEPSGNGYARVETAAGDWNSASGGSIDNADAITFPAASGSWGTVTHVALFDASSGGNLLMSGALSSSETITIDQVPRFAAGELTLTLS
jgi:hypothetical protein